MPKSVVAPISYTTPWDTICQAQLVRAKQRDLTCLASGLREVKCGPVELLPKNWGAYGWNNSRDSADAMLSSGRPVCFKVQLQR
jgi:hypothetical protein